MINLIENDFCKYSLKKGLHYIYDDHLNNKPIFITNRLRERKGNGDKWSLVIINKKEEIYFYQVDECLMKNALNHGKRVDWICYDDVNFYFVEAKDVKKKKNIDKKDVEEKFINSMNYYNLNLIQQNNSKIHWILNVRSPNTITNSGDNTKKAKYKEYYQVDYNETNLICFK